MRSHIMSDVARVRQKTCQEASYRGDIERVPKTASAALGAKRVGWLASVLKVRLSMHMTFLLD